MFFLLFANLFFKAVFKQVSKIKCKTKVITLICNLTRTIVKHNTILWTNNNSKLLHVADRKRERFTIGFDFTSDWMKKWRECFKPIVINRVENQILFDSEMKTSLTIFFSLINSDNHISYYLR